MKTSLRIIVGEIVKKFSGEGILNVREIKNKGQVNDVFVIETPSSKYVVRIDKSESTLSRFRKEEWCIKEAQKEDVLSPKVLELGIKNNKPYILLSYVGGVDGDETPKNVQKRIWFELGRYARKIHSVEVKGYGEKMTSRGYFNDNWKRFLDYNISNLNAKGKLLTLNILTPKQSQILKQIFKELKKGKFKFGLAHHDLSLKNTKYLESEIYLLDWGSAEVNVVPHTDIGEILRSSLDETSLEFKRFLKGYKMDRLSFEKIKPTTLKLLLLSRTNKLLWAIDKKPELIAQKTREFRKIFDRFFNL